MKKTLNIEDDLMREACGATSDTETVRLGLRGLVRQAAYQRLKSLRGSEADAKDVPRRREEPPSKPKAD